MSTVKVLSMNRADPLHFTKIKDFGDMQDLTFDDMLFITAERDGEEITKNVRVRDFGKFFTEFNVNAQWFVPVVNGTKISWRWSDAVASLPDIDIAAMISTASPTKNGLMSSIDKAKLDSLRDYELPIATTETLGGIKPDGQSVVVNESGVLSVLSGMPMCIERTLYASAWDTDTLTQKVFVDINVNNRNVIDFTPDYVQSVAHHHILAVKEENDGITFQCDSIPVSDITVYITSMGVVRSAD